MDGEGVAEIGNGRMIHVPPVRNLKNEWLLDGPKNHLTTKESDK